MDCSSFSQCHFCDTNPESLPEALLHFRQHCQLSNFICRACGINFNNEIFLVKHIAENSVPHTCPEDDCDVSFLSKKCLHFHWLFSHGSCRLCPKVCASSKDFDEHMSEHKNGKRRSRICQKCGKYKHSKSKCAELINKNLVGCKICKWHNITFFNRMEEHYDRFHPWLEKTKNNGVTNTVKDSSDTCSENDTNDGGADSSSRTADDQEQSELSPVVMHEPGTNEAFILEPVDRSGMPENSNSYEVHEPDHLDHTDSVMDKKVLFEDREKAWEKQIQNMASDSECIMTKEVIDLTAHSPVEKVPDLYYIVDNAVKSCQKLLKSLGDCDTGERSYAACDDVIGYRDAHNLHSDVVTSCKSPGQAGTMWNLETMTPPPRGRVSYDKRRKSDNYVNMASTTRHDQALSISIGPSSLSNQLGPLPTIVLGSRRRKSSDESFSSPGARKRRDIDPSLNTEADNGEYAKQNPRDENFNLDLKAFISLSTRDGMKMTAIENRNRAVQLSASFDTSTLNTHGQNYPDHCQADNYNGDPFEHHDLIQDKSFGAGFNPALTMQNLGLQNSTSNEQKRTVVYNGFSNRQNGGYFLDYNPLRPIDGAHYSATLTNNGPQTSSLPDVQIVRVDRNLSKQVHRGPLGHQSSDQQTPLLPPATMTDVPHYNELDRPTCKEQDSPEVKRFLSLFADFYWSEKNPRSIETISDDVWDTNTLSSVAMETTCSGSTPEMFGIDQNCSEYCCMFCNSRIDSAVNLTDHILSCMH